MKKENSKKGFTIVEVALVLAIAGLIFLMVFLVLPSVQRTQRDAKRRDDVGRLLTAITKYQTNNRGSLPSVLKEGDAATSGEVTWDQASAAGDGAISWEGLYKSFLGESFEDPAGYHYVLSIRDCEANTGSGDNSCTFGNQEIDRASSPENAGYKMFVVRRAACDGSRAIKSDNPRKVAVLYKMEGSGGAYCANTQQ